MGWNPNVIIAVFIKTHLPSRGGPREESISTSALLLAKRRHGLDINQALETQRKEFHIKMERIKRWKEEFWNKTEHMKEQLLKFNHFIEDNDKKRIRALMKADSEYQLRLQKERDLTQLQTEVKHLRRLRDDLNRRIECHSAYKKFADRVVHSSTL
ncbi:coiled-coil domain-containing protein 42 like-2-like, partial [Cetorhinus maximus]